MFAPPGSAPAVTVLRRNDFKNVVWSPPKCTGWPASARSKLVVAVAGSFRFAGGTDALLARIGAISAFRDVRYWSVSDKAWRPLADDASALSSSDPRSRRADFGATELTQGAALHYVLDDSKSAPVVYRMRLLERGADRLVLASENASPVLSYLITLFEPGTLQTVEFLERRGPDLWTFYLLTRIDERASILAGRNEASYINRAVARFRYLAGLPTEHEPPAAR